jgi:hypothetical protein
LSRLVQGEDEVRETAVGGIIGCDKQLLNVVEREGEEEEEREKMKQTKSRQSCHREHCKILSLQQPTFLLSSCKELLLQISAEGGGGG